MNFQVYHCFCLGEKHFLRKHGIKIKKVKGKDLTYTLTIPDSMVYKEKDCCGEIFYEIRSQNDSYIGSIIFEKYLRLPGPRYDPHFYFYP